MKIGQQQTSPTRSFITRNVGWLAGLALAFAIGLAVGDQGWQRAAQVLCSIQARVAQLAPSFDDSALPSLAVDMDGDLYYNGILDQRQRAIEAGVLIPSRRDFMTATISAGGATIPVRMRLAPGPATRLGDEDKWGFEVRTRQNQQLLGMQRFYLQDPAANNWLNLWAFASALEREGVLTARCRFVRLTFNGADRGIYTLQQGFSGELLAAQGRPEGVIIRFDTDLLWESIAHFGGDAQAAYADPIANLSASDLQFFEIDAWRDAAIARDPALSTQRERAIGMLRALQTGDLKASQVFDVERYGRFLALVDLWDASEAISLVNLHYAYDPSSDRLEPIGFSANPLASDARLPLAATYYDSAMQAAYVREAWRISQPEYLEQLHVDLQPELQRLQQAVRVEHEAAPPWESLRARQEAMRRSLNPIQPVFAYLGPPTLTTSGAVRIDVGNVLNLPVEIVGFDVHGGTFLPAERGWLQDDYIQLLTDDADKVILRPLDPAQAPVIRYARFHIPLAEIHRLDSELEFTHELDIQVATRILGLPATHLTLAQPGYPDVFIVGGGRP